MVVVSVSWKEFQKIDGVCRQDTLSQYTLCSTVWLQRAPNNHSARLIFVSEKSLVIWCVACLILGCSLTRFSWALPLLHLSILPHSMNTQYITHISKLPRLTSCAMKNHSAVKDLQSGGNQRTTTPTGYEPKELATVSRIEAYSGDPYQLYHVQEWFGKEDHWALFTEEVEEFGKF